MGLITQLGSPVNNANSVSFQEQLEKVNELVQELNDRFTTLVANTLLVNSANFRDSIKLGGQTIANTETIYTSATFPADVVSNSYFQATYTAADVLAKLITVDGSGSGLDADLLDGHSSAYFAALASPTFTGTVTIPTGVVTTLTANTYTGNTINIRDSIKLGGQTIANTTTIWTAANDGSGTGLDSDTVDGLHGTDLVSNSYFQTQYTASTILTKLLTVDGSGSGLDADLLDGISSASFAQLSGATFTGNVTLNGADLKVYRSGGTTGFVALTSAGNHYIMYDGSGYLLGNTAGLTCGGTVTAAAFNTSSDIRLKDVKETLSDYAEAITNLSRMDIIKYVRKDDPEKYVRYGVSAQQVENLIPEAVFKDNRGYLTVDYDMLVALNIAATKKLETALYHAHLRIAALEQRLDKGS